MYVYGCMHGITTYYVITEKLSKRASKSMDNNEQGVVKDDNGTDNAG